MGEEVTRYKELLAKRDEWRKSGMPVSIKECVYADELFRHYDGQTERQPCYIELGLHDGIMLADWNAIVGNGTHESVRNGFDRQWPIPCLTADAANRVMQEIAPLASRMLADWEEKWDGNNNVAVLGEDAQAAEEEIRAALGLVHGSDFSVREVFDESDLVAVWSIDGVTNGCETSEYDITAETTDERLAAIEKEILSDLEAPGGVAVCHGLDRYLKELRERASEEG